MHERVERHFVVLRAAVDEGGGEVFATMGDGIAAAFTSVDGALLAAVTAQQQMPSIGLSVRMGIHTGEVERVGDDFRGRSVNRAARIMAVGHGGQILLSDVSAALARSGSARSTLTDLGTHRLRDLTEPERVWQVVHPDLRRQFPPVRGRRHVLEQPAGPALVVGRPRRRRAARRRSDAAASHRDAHRRRRRGQDPPGSARRGGDALGVRHRVVRRAGQRRRPGRRRRHHRPSPRRRGRGRPVGGGRGAHWPVAGGCSSSTTAST